jgi:hemoglobin-like flavoprotein
MTPDQVTLIQASFVKVQTISETAAVLFYDRLFQLDPSLRLLFSNDMTAQRQKLMQMLSAAVHGLRNPERLLPVLRELGERHNGYGVQASHYTTVGLALIWTLRQGLGSAFTPPVEAAWTAAYQLIAETMQSAVPV